LFKGGLNIGAFLLKNLGGTVPGSIALIMVEARAEQIYLSAQSRQFAFDTGLKPYVFEGKKKSEGAWPICVVIQ